MEHTEGKVGYKWPLMLKTKPIDWVYQRGTKAAIYDSNDDLVAVVPQKQAGHIFSILNSHDDLLVALEQIAGHRILVMDDGGEADAMAKVAKQAIAKAREK